MRGSRLGSREAQLDPGSLKKWNALANSVFPMCRTALPSQQTTGGKFPPWAADVLDPPYQDRERRTKIGSRPAPTIRVTGSNGLSPGVNVRPQLQALWTHGRVIVPKQSAEAHCSRNLVTSQSFLCAY